MITYYITIFFLTFDMYDNSNIIIILSELLFLNITIIIILEYKEKIFLKKFQNNIILKLKIIYIYLIYI